MKLCSSDNHYTTAPLNFSVPIEKEVTRFDKKGREITKTTSYRLQFIDSARFMRSSLNLVNSLAEGIHKINVNNAHHDKKCETCRIKYKDCESFLQYTKFKDNRIQMFML